MKNVSEKKKFPLQPLPLPLYININVFLYRLHWIMNLSINADENKLQYKMFYRQSVENSYNLVNCLFCITKCLQHFNPIYSALPYLWELQELEKSGKDSTQEIPYFPLKK